MSELARTEGVRVRATEVDLHGQLAVPYGAAGVVILAHAGSGGPPGAAVAEALEDAGLAVLRLDLLTDEEALADEVDHGYRENAPLLARRLAAAKRWALEEGIPEVPAAGYFATGTAASAALVAAADDPDGVGAVVAAGGRPELALERLASVAAPTLLIAGERDPIVLNHNRQVLPELGVEKELRVIEGAGDLFAEAAAEAEAANAARDWFLEHLAPVSGGGFDGRTQV